MQLHFNPFNKAVVIHFGSASIFLLLRSVFSEHIQSPVVEMGISEIAFLQFQ